MKKNIFLFHLLLCVQLSFAQYGNWYQSFLSKDEKVYSSFKKNNKNGTCFIIQNGKIDGRNFKIESYKNIRILDVSSCKIDNYPEFLFRVSKLKNLQYLNLSNLRLGIDTFTIKDLKFTQLKWLSIANCGYIGVDESIKNLSNLEYLNLGLETGHFQIHNRISSLPKSFSSLTELRTLFFAFNELENIPSVIFELKNLEYLNFQGNRLSSLPGEIKLLAKLKELVIDHNKFEVLPLDILELENLRSLNLSGNNIKEVPQQLCNLTNLENLVLSNNPLSSISFLFCLNKLRNISLSNCRIGSTFEAHQLPKTIEYLNLSGNKIIKLSNLDNLTNLTKLVISGNLIPQNDIKKLRRRKVIIIN